MFDRTNNNMFEYFSHEDKELQSPKLQKRDLLLFEEISPGKQTGQSISRNDAKEVEQAEFKENGYSARNDIVFGDKPIDNNELVLGKEFSFKDRIVNEQIKKINTVSLSNDLELSKQVKKLKYFWRGTIANYQYTFVKMTELKQENKDPILDCVEDLSYKTIYPNNRFKC